MAAAIRWPAKPEEYLSLAHALADLVGGRNDVAARYFNFTDADRTVRGWGPWKGRRVAADYKALAGETVMAFKDYKKPGAVEFRLLNPLSPGNLVEHLRGKERLGVYVLDAQARCKFLAADFDDHGGQLAPGAVWAEVRRFVETCTVHGWHAAIERSKSGTGYHAWLFFDAPVEAAKVRAIGRWLFEESQALREGEDFSTFDRFFPAQGALPPAGRGFGNLIGLPMCGPKDYAAGKTAWVDHDGELVLDPAAYVEQLRGARNPAGRIDAFMAEWQLTIDEPEAYTGAARDPNVKLGTAEEFDAVRSRCAFIPWVSDPNGGPSEWPGQTHEPLWFAWLSNLARFEAGATFAHESNRWHPKYLESHTDYKIEHARTSSGPQTCDKIRREGFKGCPAGGCPLPNGKPTKAPAGLAAWATPPTEHPKSRDRTVRITDLGPTAAPVPTESAAAEGAATASSEPVAPWKSTVPIYPETKLPWPAPVGGFLVTTEGVQDHSNAIICARPLWLEAITQNNIGQRGLVIRYFDVYWKLFKYAIPIERLSEQGGVLAKELNAWGAMIVPGKEKWVSRYLMLQQLHCDKLIRAAGRLGWFDAADAPAVFVLPSQVLGKAPDEIVYQPDVPMPVAETLHGRGKLAEWQANVANPCIGNPVLMFSVMLGLAGPLLKLCQVETGGFHLYGVTTAGKTTAAQLAASVWGCAADPQEGPEVTSLRKWYTTGNALESLAEVHNDMLLTLDEISEVDPQALGQIIYQLAGGVSKGRANAGGGMRGMRAWRLLFFSTGEKSVRQMLAQVNQTQKGGQRVRLPDIPINDDEDGSRAIVLNPGAKTAKDFAQDLKAACARYYGLAGPTFAAYLIAQAEQIGMANLCAQLREDLAALEVLLCKDIEDKLPPEGRRVIRRFALVAVAGLRAGTETGMAGILRWDMGQILQAVRHVRDRWLSDQGTEHSEADRGLAHVRNQLIRHGDRFRWIDGTVGGRPAARDLLGYRVRDFYLITEEGLRELCGEHDMRAILRALKTGDYLWHDAGRLTKKSPAIEELGKTRPRLYWVKVELLGEQSEFDTEEDLAVAKAAPPARPQGDIPF
jgi:uncharacterized protein (DUF927 family)